jgi:LysM repeat protein
MKRVLILGLLLAILAIPAFAETAVAAPAEQAYTIHVVQPGETLYGIAMRYGVSATAIANANNLYNPDFIYAGQRLVIPGTSAPPSGQYPPPSSCTYTVRLGDTLSSIAARYGTTVTALMQVNGISNPNFIYAGQVLTIPGCGNQQPSCPNCPPPGHHPKPPPHPGHPPCGQTYTVKPGDSLSRIAAWYGTTVSALAHANGLSYPYVIHPGQTLVIPCHGTTPPAKPPTGLHPAACAREVQIVDPLQGEHVDGTVQIIGSAKIADFQFYKLEYAMGHTPLDTAFHSINDVYRTPAWDTVLGTWYVGNMPAGAYTLRLTAVDNRGQFPTPCNVQIWID